MARNFAVMGLGSFGSTVAEELQRLGNDVLGVDRDEERVRVMAERIAEAVIADVRDRDALEELGLKQYDAVLVAIGEDLESNLLCTLALKNLGVGEVWVKALTPSHHHILNRLGADRIIHPEHEIGVHVAYSLNYPFVLDYISMGGDYFVVEMEVGDGLQDTPLGDLELRERYNLRFLALKRGREPLDEDPADIVLARGDRMVLLGHFRDLKRFGASL